MQNKEGLFIVIEGVDGAGKATQFKQLVKRLELAGYDVATFDFPRYREPSSYFVKQYLNGAYGDRADAVSPYTASLFFALDRFAAAKQIHEALDSGKIVLANRFTGSNMAAQGTKFSNADERRGYFIWLDNLEFEMLQIPRPNLNLVLRVPADIAQKQVDKKEKRDYTDKKRDLHEADDNLMRRSVEVYDDLCQLFPRDFVRIDCVRGDTIMPIEIISNLVWEKVLPYLPKPTRNRKQARADTTPSASVSTENPYLEKSGRRKAITDMGESYLADIVTDPRGTVYGFTDNISPATVAAAMAQSSHRADGLRITLLDEFAQGRGKDEAVLRRAIQTSGSETAQQLVGVHMAVEGGSNLLAQKLEQGGLNAYLEQPARYLYLDQKGSDGKYKYYVPDDLSTEIDRQYREHLDAIFDSYTDMSHQLTHYLRSTSEVPKAEQDSAWHSTTRARACDVARSVLPLATIAPVSLFTSAQALERLLIRLQSDELPEARTAGKQLLEQARAIIPSFLEHIDQPEHGGALIAYRADTAAAIEKLAAQYLPDNHAAQTQNPVDLVDVWPRNELDLVADMLYEHSNVPLRDLQRIAATWPYDKKSAVLSAYIGERLDQRQQPGPALEKARYSWDIVCDYDAFRELQRHHLADDTQWQPPTPRYGYDVPQLVDDAGLTEQFETCFDISLKLYSILQQAGYVHEAQYATLFGHRLRWNFTYNARQAFRLLEQCTSPRANPLVRTLTQRMHDKLGEVHPLLADAMKLADANDDPELTRRSAERYTQFKLRQQSGS